MVTGRVTSFNSSLLEDFVLERSNGVPTYYLANVVDDHVMGINHMIRGADGSDSAPRQMLLYRAFGWLPPVFGFFPILRMAEEEKGTPIPTIREFRDRGVPPSMLTTYLLSLNVPKPADNIEDALALCGSLLLSKAYSMAPATFSSRSLISKLQKGKREAVATVEIENLLRKRDVARREGDFNTADQIRKRLIEAGVSLSDSPAGTSWKWRL
jgi:glutamyl/glutaminyl-tRNA synthetase